MAKRVSAAEAKAKLPELVAKVAYGGEKFIIERRGKPVAALVSPQDLERLEAETPENGRPRGALALVGMWSDILDDDEVDQFIRDIYEAREREQPRPVRLDWDE